MLWTLRVHPLEMGIEFKGEGYIIAILPVTVLLSELILLKTVHD
jgi:hypothetical protein